MFNINDLDEENPVVAEVVKNIIMLLQRCLKSKSNAVFHTAIDQVAYTSDNYGPALNKHLKLIMPMVEKRNDKASAPKISELKNTLIENGGDEAAKIIA